MDRRNINKQSWDISIWDREIGIWKGRKILDLPIEMQANDEKLQNLLSIVAPMHARSSYQRGWGNKSGSQGYATLVAKEGNPPTSSMWKRI